MKIINTVREMQEFSTSCRKKDQTIAVVPTMGGLHEGHLSLIDIASEKADTVIVTIFLNPTQFGENEDLSSYPATMEEDLRLWRQ